ncbi:uncharacterized protein LOC143769145 [Ranitomeya variabilis]|uniref:uncharacterized protein LOC143769145 n=1 Tax=Ranitomeya variabilis TaxID=490064 RepID=UPI0040564A06
MGDRLHAGLSVTCRLWEQICRELIARWEDLDVQAQIQERERTVKRWRSIRDRFKKEFNKEMRAPSGSGGRRSKYKYARALSFLRSTMVTRSLKEDQGVKVGDYPKPGQLGRGKELGKKRHRRRQSRNKRR